MSNHQDNFSTTNKHFLNWIITEVNKRLPSGVLASVGIGQNLDGDAIVSLRLYDQTNNQIVQLEEWGYFDTYVFYDEHSELNKRAEKFVNKAIAKLEA